MIIDFHDLRLHESFRVWVIIVGVQLPLAADAPFTENPAVGDAGAIGFARGRAFLLLRRSFSHVKEPVRVTWITTLLAVVARIPNDGKHLENSGSFGFRGNAV